MKRVISALLSVLLLGCLTACSRDDGQSKNGDSRSGTLKVAIGETNTDFDGVSVRILNLAEDEGKTQLNVRWVNETSYEVVYGESYDRAAVDLLPYIFVWNVGKLLFALIKILIRRQKWCVIGNAVPLT